jgi:hypothetical protein
MSSAFMPPLGLLGDAQVLAHVGNGGSATQLDLGLTQLAGD